VTQLGPVLVKPAPDRTAKFPAVLEPGMGFTAASAEAGQIRITRAARLTDKRVRRIFFTS
jgi:hypothetical protein